MLTLTFLTLGSFLHSKLQSIHRGRLALRTFFGKIGRGSKCLIKHFGKTIRGSKCKSVAIDYSRLYVLPVSHFDDVWSHVATESCHIQCTEDRASTSSTSGTLNKSHKMPQDATRCHKMPHVFKILGGYSEKLPAHVQHLCNNLCFKSCFMCVV